MFNMVNRYAAAVITLAGFLTLVSGFLVWFHVAPSLLSMHMLLGVLTVAGLWTIAIAQAVTAGGSWALAALAVILGALTIYLGINQAGMLPGELHWIIRTGHLVLGILCIGVGHMSAARHRRVPNLSSKLSVDS